ncbi:MAG: hypothetical protein ACRD93_03320 [Nitrososphaeraceae archaeon]
MASITVSNQVLLLLVNKAQANPNHARPNETDIDAIVYTALIIALVNVELATRFG